MSNESKKSEKTIEDLYEIATTSVEEWIKKNCLGGETLRTQIHRKLDISMNDIISKILGFDNHWGNKWEVDHCNGRISEVGNYIKQKAGSAVYEWLDKCAGNLTNIKPDRKAIASLKAEAKDAFQKKVREEIRRRAEDAAIKFVEDMVSKISLDEKKIEEGTNALKFISVFSKVAQPDDEDKK